MKSPEEGKPWGVPGQDDVVLDLGKVKQGKTRRGKIVKIVFQMLTKVISGKRD